MQSMRQYPDNLGACTRPKGEGYSALARIEIGDYYAEYDQPPTGIVSPRGKNVSIVRTHHPTRRRTSRDQGRQL